MSEERKPIVAIVMGSESDWPTMKLAAQQLDHFNVPYLADVVSAHRTPEKLYDFAKSAKANGLKVIIAGAGGAAHLPGMISSLTTLPVLGIPIKTSALHGQDSLLSIVQMPGGVPTATFAIGATNAAIFAVQILALSNPELAERLVQHKSKLVEKVTKMTLKRDW